MVEGLVTRLGSDGQELLDALLQSTAEAVYAVDNSGRVLFANPAAVSTLGFESEDELIGCPSHATIHHSHPDGTPFPESECPLLRPRATGVSVRVEEDWFIRRDGTFVPVAYSSARVSLAGHTDFGLAKRAETAPGLSLDPPLFGGESSEAEI